MSFKSYLIMGFFAVVLLGVFVVSGCCEKQTVLIPVPVPAPGPAEKAGAALDKAMDKTNIKIKDAADKAADKAGEALEKVGAALEKTGSDMKNGNP